MNRYFMISILCLGLLLFLPFASLFSSTNTFFNKIEGEHPMQATLQGFPLWMYLMFLFTLGIFFLIFGFKTKMSNTRD